MKRIGNVLIIGSLLFFLETAFEMYVLTLIQGPQMIGFSIAHIAPVFFILVIISALFYVCLAVFALRIVLLKFFGKTSTEDGYFRLMLIVLIVQFIHTTLLLTYNYWSPLLLRKGG